MFVYVVALISAVALTSAYPTGAPKQACYDMIPGHGASIQQTEAPYTITTALDSVQAGSSIEVVISGNSPKDTMRGILLEARQGDKIVGTWTVDPNDPFGQLLDCDAPGDAVTHKKHPADLDKQTVSYRWNAPEDLVGKVKFLVTIVKTYSEFWVKVESAEIQVTPHH